MRKIIILLVFLLSLSNAQSEYELGKGAQVASLPLYIGGYFSLDYKSKDGADRYSIDDIALMGYGGYDKFSYLGEIEFKKLYVETHIDSQKDTKEDRQLYIERLFIDYRSNENYMFRVGKYNSPVGFWNMLPINVLKETTSHPVSTSIIFPKFTTGASASYLSFGSGELKIDMMLQNNEDIDDDYNNYKIDKHYGLGITYERDEFAIKLNGGLFRKVSADDLDNDFNDDDDEEEEYEDLNDDDFDLDDDFDYDDYDNESVSLHYFLASIKYESEKYQIMGEVGTQKANNRVTTKYAGYIQGLYRFSEKHLAVLRAESYDNRVSDTVNHMMIFGYTYRPIYPVALKSEYQFNSKSELNQFLFSLSVLF